MEWKELLRGLKPREDLPEAFAADSFDVEQPALLNKNSVLIAATVAARLLEIIARRGGTRVKPSSAEALRRILRRTLPEAAYNLCEDEASRVLRWLEEAEEYQGEGPDTGAHKESPEVEIVFDADIESRISVAEFALEEGFDLEMEYLDTDENIWPRLRCTPLELNTFETDEGDEQPSLRVDSDFGEYEIPIHHIRWLMPVSSHEHRRARKKDTGATVLTFPSGGGEDA